MNLLVELLSCQLPLLPLSLLETVCDESRLSLVSDLCDLLHGRERFLHDVTVVSLWSVSLPLQLKGRVVRQVFPLGCPVSLRPLHLTRITPHFEVVVALGLAEAKYLRVRMI